MSNAHDPSMSFDGDGVCSHCQRFDLMRQVRMCDQHGDAPLEALVQRMKRDGADREYDCVVGVSGGVDSTFLAAVLKNRGLRPLAVHFDNGWNSELAVSNIERALHKLDVELLTYVVEWNEFRDIQISFLRAGTPDGEVPTDHGVYACLWQTAARLNVRYVASGMNFATESSSVPDWAYGHIDWRYIKDVHRRFGSTPIRSFPHFSLRRLMWWMAVRGMRWVSPLNYLQYKRHDAVRYLQENLGWRDYGGKHHESIYTRFYQSWYLPTKFGIDKRVIHLSDMIRSGQLGRDAALRELQLPPVAPDVAAADRDYVVKKLGLSADEFDAILRAPPRTFRHYRNNAGLIGTGKRVLNMMRRIQLLER
jgi:N-acetyl sugar amidotransferase